MLAPDTILTMLAGLAVFVTIAAVILTTTVRPAIAVWVGLLLLFFGNSFAGTSSIKNEAVSTFQFIGRFLPTLGILLLTVAVFIRRSLNGVTVFKGRGLLIRYWPFAVLMVLSAAYNESLLRDLVTAGATYFRYPLFFVLVVSSGLRGEEYKRVLHALVWLSLLQIPITLYERLIIGRWAADINGSLGGNHGLVAVLLVAQTLLLSRWFASERRNYKDLILVVALLIPSLVGDIKVGVIYLVVLVAYLSVRSVGWTRSLKKLAGAMAAVAAAITILSFSDSRVAEHVHSFTLIHTMGGYREEIDWRDTNLASFGSIGRLTILPLSFPLLLDDPIRFLLGYGPESARGGLTSGSGAVGKVCRKLAEIGILCRGPQSFKSLMEYGVLGFLLQVFPLVWLWKTVGTRLRKQDGVENRVVSHSFDASCLLYVVLQVFYIGAWRMDWHSFPFWIVAALGYMQAFRSNATELEVERAGAGGSRAWN